MQRTVIRQVLACAATMCFGLLAWSAQQSVAPKKKSPPKGKTTTAARRTTTVHHTAPARSAARKSTKTASKGGKRAPAPRTTAFKPRQFAPTPDRYREIQDALAAKGYLKPEDVNGTWDQNSVDALKRFQAAQKIESTGKINSLSLIALGLGPKHDSAAAKPPAPTPGSAPERP